MILITLRYFIRNIRQVIKIIFIIWLIKLAYRIFNSEKTLNGIGIIEGWGYPAEQHNVTTDDGYILKTMRIPWSPLKLSKKNQQKPVVLMLNGLFTTSDLWMTSPDRSLAKQLADEGYDVWLGNYRGSAHGRDHVTLSPNDKKFWDFSFHEIGYYDIPRTIDYVLNATSQSSLICVGLSMGTTSTLITLSERPEYNSKVQLFIGFGVVAGFLNKKSIDMRPFYFFSTIFNFIDPTGTFEVLPQHSIYSILFEEVCVNLNIADYCLLPWDMICGKNYDQVDHNVTVNILKYFPAGTSAKTYMHYAQFTTYRKFQQFDYQNEKENIEHYGTAKPPQYNFENIKSPMIFFYGPKNDPLSTFDDLSEIIQRVSSKVITEPVSGFSHGDFIAAKDVKKLFNNLLIERLGDFFNGNISF